MGGLVHAVRVKGAKGESQLAVYKDDFVWRNRTDPHLVFPPCPSWPGLSTFRRPRIRTVSPCRIHESSPSPNPRDLSIDFCSSQSCSPEQLPGIVRTMAARTAITTTWPLRLLTYIFLRRCELQGNSGKERLGVGCLEGRRSYTTTAGSIHYNNGQNNHGLNHHDPESH